MSTRDTVRYAAVGGAVVFVLTFAALSAGSIAWAAVAVVLAWLCGVACGCWAMMRRAR